MKRFLALAALVLGLASCQTEPEGLDVNVGGEVDTTITVSIPDSETRAGGNDSAKGVFDNGILDAENVTMRYILQVFQGVEANGTTTWKASKETKFEYSDERETITFDVRLVPGRDYKFVVWADVVTNGVNDTDNHYNTHNGEDGVTDLTNVTLNNTWVAMDESRDAFTGVKLVENYSSSSTINFQLTRPFAKLRVITTDMVELNNLGIRPYKAVVTYTTDHYESFNALDGSYAGEKTNISHSYTIADYTDFANTEKEDSHKVLFADYFFANNEVVNFTLDVMEQNGTRIKLNTFNTPIPAQRNYLTTISGNILTDGNNIKVDVQDAFADADGNKQHHDYNTISSAAEFIAALDANGEFIVISDINIANAGDIVSNGQMGTLATRAGGKKSIIDLNGHTITVNNNSTEALATVAEGNTVTILGEGTIELSGSGSFINNEGTVELANVNIEGDVFSGEGKIVDYADYLREAFENPEKFNNAYSLVYDVIVSESLTLAAGKTLVLDLNGKTITGYDKGTASYGLIVNQGELTVKNGTITLKAEQNRGWNAYSSVISNSTGKLFVEDGAVIEHLGGTDMAYGIDNLSGSKAAYATINGGHIKSPYRAIRQFMNSDAKQNELVVNGGIIEGANKSIWMQDPSKKSNLGKLTVAADAQLKGDVYLFVTAGSTEWPVEVSIANAAFVGESTVVTGNVPAAYSVVEKEDVWIVEKCYEQTENGYAIKSAAGLIWLSEEVLNGNTFEGKTIELTADIDLTGVTTNGDSFGPIGRYCSGQGVNKPFKGHFNGNNHTIKGIYQSGWDFGYEWGTTGYLGLFGYAIDVTVENLTIEGMESVVEGGTLAAVAGRADGKCVFKNITVKDTDLGTYNNRCGGIVGWTGYYKNEADETVCEFTFENINICEDVVLGGLWGSFDSSIGGIMGQLNSGATACVLKNVTVSCRIDAYNDCTASYDYYLYRMCGMLIGQMSKTTTIDGSTYPDVAAYGIEFDNVTVNYGKWMNYHYCEPTPGLNGGRGMRVEAGFTYDGLPSDFDHTQCVDNHYNCIPFDQLFGGTQTACKGVKAWEGVTVNYPAAYTCDLCGETHNE